MSPINKGSDYMTNAALRFLKKVFNYKECWNWNASLRNESGYGQINFMGKMQGAHRVSYMLFKGEIPNGLCVLHKCDNPLCVNPYHLFLGTNKDNVADRERKGRGNQPHGSMSGNAKLKESDIPEIFALRLSGLTQQEIADNYGVAQCTISDVLHGKRWSRISKVSSK